MHKTVFATAAALALSSTLSLAQDAPAVSEPRHVILIIGDGMDEQQVTIARNYLKGATGELLLDKMPVRGASQILTVEDKVNGKPLYVADSANTATSMATGVVTSPARIGTTAGSDQDIPTIIELAQTAGYRTGIVSTASITDATPSSFAAHVALRFCENPDQIEKVEYKGIDLGGCPQDMKKNGGPGSISEQLAVSGVDVLLGGGSQHFTPMAEGQNKTVLEVAQDEGYQILQNADELTAARPGKPLLGLFSPSTMPVRLQGEGGRISEQPEPSLLNYVHDYLGDVTLPESMECEPNPEFAAVPTLKQMTDAALTHLAQDNDRGFFLTIESASIDKQSHERKPCGSIGEVEQLDEALASALAFADKNPRTLIIVTADHSQAAQLLAFPSMFAKYPIPIYSPGHVSVIETPEGGAMMVNYATSNFIMEEHTGAAVPLYANEEGEGLVPPYLRQPEIFGIMKAYLGL
ncbi:alkaline phosphatase [Halioglobus maricola]|uniref:Alkaline phosphatase n=1 Tax=Halioglobus maricola TaxID=2601894 RepID=A0A5P9NI74_9GAMM|nr:alkaline phosphatase [Halioglobus maricola]QFU75249.1 alkaline phosphatase [Halioglobus maricola]